MSNEEKVKEIKDSISNTSESLTGYHFTPSEMNSIADSIFQLVMQLNTRSEIEQNDKSTLKVKLEFATDMEIKPL